MSARLGDPGDQGLKCGEFAALLQAGCASIAGTPLPCIRICHFFAWIRPLLTPFLSVFVVILRRSTWGSVCFACHQQRKQNIHSNNKVDVMKRLLIGLAALVALALVASDAMAQTGRVQGRATGGKSSGTAIQTRTAAQDRVSQSQQRNCSPRGQVGNQLWQPPGVLAADGSSPDLRRLWEEEKLARDVYTSLAKTSTLAIFRNISRAESQHMQSVERLLRSRDANAVQLNDTPSVFIFPEYQRL